MPNHSGKGKTMFHGHEKAQEAYTSIRKIIGELGPEDAALLLMNLGIITEREDGRHEVNAFAFYDIIATGKSQSAVYAEMKIVHGCIYDDSRGVFIIQLRSADDTYQDAIAEIINCTDSI